MKCSECECLVRVKNKLGYNLYYCGYKKYGVLKALCGLYINNEEYRKDNETCKYYKAEKKGRKEMTDEEKAIDLTSKSFELEKDKVEWFCSTYKNSRMSEIHTFYNGVLVGLAEGRKELEKENEELKSRVESLICNLMDIQNKIDEIVTTPKIMQKEENELLCKLIKRICEYTRSN